MFVFKNLLVMILLEDTHVLDPQELLLVVEDAVSQVDELIFPLVNAHVNQFTLDEDVGPQVTLDEDVEPQAIGENMLLKASP